MRLLVELEYVEENETKRELVIDIPKVCNCQEKNLECLVKHLDKRKIRKNGDLVGFLRIEVDP